MAEQKNIMDVTIPEASSPINGYLYIVIDNLDYRISYDELVKFLQLKSTVRAEGNISVTEGENVIEYKLNGVVAPVDSTDYSLLIWSDMEGMIKPNSQDANGFIINVLDAGVINYQLILNT